MGFIFLLRNGFLDNCNTHPSGPFPQADSYSPAGLRLLQMSPFKDQSSFFEVEGVFVIYIPRCKDGLEEANGRQFVVLSSTCPSQWQTTLIASETNRYPWPFARTASLSQQGLSADLLCL